MPHHTTTHHGCDAAIPTVCFTQKQAPQLHHLLFVPVRSAPHPHRSSPQMCALTVSYCSPAPHPQGSPVKPASHLVSSGFQLFNGSRRRCPACPPSYKSKIFKALSVFPMPCSSLISCCSAESNHLLSPLPSIFSQMSEHKSHP